MKLNNWTILALAALAVTLPVSAQDNPQPKHRQYKLYDMGTFGGPDSYPSVGAVTLTTAGAVGGADTSRLDPFSPHCLEPECYVMHAFQWRTGVLTDLGALPGNNGGNSSYAFAINNAGLIGGISETGAIDPATGYPEVNAVIWQDGNIINLGTFGGTQSAAEMMNNPGQVVGIATNNIPDPFSFGGAFPATTQTRAFLWEKGFMRDLGTLGGPDARAIVINQKGQVIGLSYTSYNPNPGSGIPTVDPFLWDKGKIIDLGTLGGTYGQALWINNRGQVVGNSNVAGDQSYHGFVWDRGTLTDLGTLGGTYSAALWINDNGMIAGVAGLPGDGAFPAAVWIHGQIVNLGLFASDDLGNATSVNNAGQVVGFSCMLSSCNATAHAFLWDNSGPIVDLNALVQPPSNIVVYAAWDIDDSGQIAGQGYLPNGDTHMVLLVPSGDCDDDCEQRIAASQNAPVAQPATTGTRLPAFGKPADWLRNPSGRRFTTPGQRDVPSN